MDPYYFLDLDIEYSEDCDEECDLSEYLVVYPNGNWFVGCNDEDFDEYKIIYNGEEYTYIFFDNNKKIVYFYKNEKLIKQLKMSFEDINF